MTNIITTIIGLLEKVVLVLKKGLKEDNDIQTAILISLAPRVLTDPDELSRVKPYLNNLKNAIDKQNINNIAVAGSYGSGKSTLIKTFQNQYPQYKYLNISLASFKDNKGSNDPEAFERKLEISILQQMFYHVKPSEIPDSRFKRIVNITNKKLLFLTTFFVLWILSALLLFKFDYLNMLNPSKWNITYPFDWVALFSSCVFLAGVALLVKSVYRLFSNSKINKVNIKGELELGEAVEKSVFNHHLEEILYFFERTKFNVVVIEDVDRFDSTDIFTKLREINILINNSSLIKRSVKFVYAIKDEMFTDKSERVKFFEFIIPVIPFINPSNANEQLVKLIEGANLKGVLSEEFTSDVVTFIDDIDMRLLINIFQEYQVYRNVLSASLNQDKLFAILVYKNIYPDDFGLLAKRRGSLYKFLTDKETYIGKLKDELLDEINKIDSRLNILYGEASKDIKELRSVYINRLASRLKNFHSFKVVGKSVSLLEAVEDEFFNDIKMSARIMYGTYRFSYSNTYYLDEPVPGDVNFSSIEKEVSSDMTYDQRENVLNDKARNQIDILKIEKGKLRNRISELESLSVQEIFELIKIDDYLGVFNDSYLMRNLLLNGHIDEHFEDYISLLHEISLTKDDFNFERNIKSGIYVQFDYKLTKTDNLIRRLPEKYFIRDVMLNYSILECLLDNEIKYISKFEKFFNVLGKDGEKQFHFVYGFIVSNPKKLGRFVNYLCGVKPGLWLYINTKSGLSGDAVLKLMCNIFDYASLNAILKFENVESLATYIEQLDAFFQFCSEIKNINNIKNFISERNIKIKRLDLPSDEQEHIFNFIYSRNHYEITQHNISVIIKGNHKEHIHDELLSSNYTTILKLQLKELEEYIIANIESYIQNVMTLMENNCNESEETIVNILNRKDVKNSLKERLLISQNAQIQSISVIEDVDVKQMVLSKNKIAPTWNNVFDYYDSVEYCLDDTLISFLNDSANNDRLKLMVINDNANKDEQYLREISDKVLHCHELSLEAFIKLLGCFPYEFNSIRFSDFELQRIDILLDNKKIAFNVDNYKEIKGKGLSIRFIEIYQDQFVNKFSECEIEASDWLLIFRSPKISKEIKVTLIQSIDHDIITHNNEITVEVGNILGTDCFVPLGYEIIAALFKSYNNTEQRVTLINSQFPNLNETQIQSLTEELGQDYGKIFLKQRRPVFPYNDFNLNFFSNLKERDMIIRYEVNDARDSIKVFAKYQ